MQRLEMEYVPHARRLICGMIISLTINLKESGLRKSIGGCDEES